MKPTELKRRVAREAKRQIEERGFTRKRIEQHLRQLFRPRPRWIPKTLWWGVARLFIRDVGEIEQAELEEAERVLLEAVMREGVVAWEGGRASYLVGLMARVRELRARVPQGSPQ